MLFFPIIRNTERLMSIHPCLRTCEPYNSGMTTHASKRESSDTREIAYRKARVSDARAIQDLVNSLADEGQLLKRSLNDILENIRDFSVAVAGGAIVGCVALHVCWDDIAEIRSLAVLPEFRSRGVASRLVSLCLEEAAGLGVRRVFTLTYIPEFFARLGFERTSKKELPQKIWKDCLNCVRFPDCDETALTKTVDGV